MDYVASDELGNFVRLGFVLDVQFPYILVRSVQHSITILLNMFNVPSMTYPIAGPWHCAGTGSPALMAAIAANKR